MLDTAGRREPVAARAHLELDDEDVIGRQHRARSFGGSTLLRFRGPTERA